MPDLLLGSILGTLGALGVGFVALKASPYALLAKDGGSDGAFKELLEFRSDVMERIRDLEASQDRLRQETEATFDKIRAAENRIHHKMDRVAEREEALQAAEMGEMQGMVEAEIAGNMEGEQPSGNGAPEGLTAEQAAFLARRQ